MFLFFKKNFQKNKYFTNFWLFFDENFFNEAIEIENKNVKEKLSRIKIEYFYFLNV